MMRAGAAGIERVAAIARGVLRAVLAVAIAGWLLDIPVMLGRYYYTEQVLALGAGLAISLTLLERRAGAAPWARGADLVLAALVLAIHGHVAAHYPTLQNALVDAPPGAAALAVAMIAGVLEAARRRTGWALPGLVVALFALAFVGPQLPAGLATRPVSFAELSVYLALDTNALFSRVLTVATLVVAPFVVFGVLLNAFGGAAIFSSAATRLTSRLTGGPAKLSVVGSAAFGMISGSAVANVAAVGAVSIPVMSRAGYPRHVAAAIEAVSSTGGQLAPPIMGASAFLMAELLGIPYREVALAATVPALLFYLALLIAVDFEARRLGLARSAAQAPRPGTGAGAGAWRYLVPVLTLVYLLFWEGHSAARAGLVSLGVLIAVHLAWPLHAPGRRLLDAGARVLQSMSAVADIIVLAAAAGLVIGVLNLTGAAFAITLELLGLSGGALAVLLVLAALLAVTLGLGMPTVGVYILLATLVAPALVESGVPALAAHLYVLFFGMISMITPPVAIASFAAAALAEAPPWRTAFTSLRIGAGVYLVPLAFVTQPVLLLGSHDGTSAWPLASALARVTVAVGLAAAAATGHVARPLPGPVRAAAAVLALVNVLPPAAMPGSALSIAACALGAGTLAWYARKPGASARDRVPGQA